MTGFFVTSSGTGIGKTMVTAALIHQIRRAGKQAYGLKPVVSGYPSADGEPTDPEVLLAAMGDESLTIQDISPWRFAAPLSPDMAAALENQRIQLNEVVEFCQRAVEKPGIHIVEGVGGVLVPINERHTVLDWILALDLPTIVVVGSYLGALSHALTALSVLSNAGVEVAGLIVSESEDSTVALTDTCKTLGNFSDVEIYPVPRLNGPRPWQRLPDLMPLLK